MISVRHFRHQWKVRIQAALPAYLNPPNLVILLGLCPNGLKPSDSLFKGAIRLSCAPERMATASLFFGRHLMMPWSPGELRYTASCAVCKERKTVKRLLVAGHDHFSQT